MPTKRNYVWNLKYGLHQSLRQAFIRQMWIENDTALSNITVESIYDLERLDFVNINACRLTQREFVSGSWNFKFEASRV